MVDRRETAQQLPDSEGDYSRFPQNASLNGRPWYRNHQDRPTSDRGVWYFASSPGAAPAARSGRFDLPAPEGTCYLASSAAAAVGELLGPDFARMGWVPSDLLAGRLVSKVTLPYPVRAADVSVPAAARHRVTSELTTTSDYALTQAWARALWDAGFDGIRYSLRFTPGRPRGLALFGPSGIPDPPWPGDPDPETVIERVRALGFEVVNVPTKSAITIVTP